MKDLEVNNDILKKEIVKINNELNLEKQNSQKLSQIIKELEMKKDNEIYPQKQSICLNSSNMIDEENSINAINEGNNFYKKNNEIKEDNMKTKNIETNINKIEEDKEKNNIININKIEEENKSKTKTKEVNINMIEESNININIKEENNKKDYLISELNKELQNLNDNLSNSLNEDKMNELLEEIRIKDKIISSYPVKLLDGEKLLSVIFVSLDKKINYSVICKNTNIFNEVENMLYDAYPDYIETDNYFTVNGKNINKYESLEINNIKNNDIITLTIAEQK